MCMCMCEAWSTPSTAPGGLHALALSFCWYVGIPVSLCLYDHSDVVLLFVSVYVKYHKICVSGGITKLIMESCNQLLYKGNLLAKQELQST